jgi:DNA mismatch repair protein MutS2
MIYPESFEEKTGFDKVRASVQNRCATQSAKEKARTVSFSGDMATITNALMLTAEMKTICMLDNSFPENGYVDISYFLSKIKTIGSYIEPSELHSLKIALSTINNILTYFNKKENDYPTLKTLVLSAIQCSRGERRFMSTVIEEIDKVIDVYGKIQDNASPRLREIRQEITSKQSIVSKRIQSILKSAQNEGIVESESGVTVRDGHLVVPVPAMNKRKIKGLIIGESATGRTIFIEPMEIVELHNTIKELEFEEQREIVKILIAITDFIRPSYNNLVLIGDLITDIDFIRAKAYYAIEIKAGMPIVTDESRIYMKKARHPILMKALAKEHKEVVPLDIDLNYNKRILLISGPNAGGKSVCIKTVGLLLYMLQCGFLIPVSESSEMRVFKKIFIDIGDEQSLENDLSTYSSHLTNMKVFLKHADNDTLVLIDEFGTGTEPSVGGAIAEAVLTDILKKKSFGLITTHYTNLKYFASSTEGIVNGAMLFDIQHIQPLFRLEMGTPGSSFAFEIARKIGLPENVLKDAESKLGNNYIKIEKSLREIARDKKYWESKRERIRQTDKKLDELSEQYEKELIEIKEMRKKLIIEAKEQAQQVLASVNKEIENTIRTIKESQADKEKTRLARSKLEELKKTVVNNEFTDSRIDREMQKIKSRKEKKNSKSDKHAKVDDISASVNQSTKNGIDKHLSPGDKVKIKGQVAVGEIFSVGHNNVSVAMGNIIINVVPERIEKVSQTESQGVVQNKTSSITSDMLVKRLNFESVLDVRGERTLEAIKQVSVFVDEAMMLGMKEIKILHGKGNGILREEIRRYLKTLSNTLNFVDEQEEAGGAGITVVSIFN